MLHPVVCFHFHQEKISKQIYSYFHIIQHATGLLQIYMQLKHTQETGSFHAFFFGQNKGQNELVCCTKH